MEKKFVRVSGEATIGHVEKFLRRKMGLDPACQVDIICGDHLLERYQTLREIRRAIGDAAMQVGLPYLCLMGKLINERRLFCVIRVLINIL